MKKLRAQSLILFAPVLLMLGIGGWWRYNEARNWGIPPGTQPAQGYVKNVEVLPPTPLDVARGYDTRVRITYGIFKGRDWPADVIMTEVRDIPDSLQLKVEQGNESLPQVVRPYNRYDEEISNEQHTTTYVMALADIPQSAGEVRLSGGMHAVFACKGKASSINKLERFAKVNFYRQPGVLAAANVIGESGTTSVLLRRRGERTEVPPVDKTSPLSVRRAKAFMSYDHQSWNSTTVEGFVNVMWKPGWLEKRRPMRWQSFDSHVVDETGRVYRSFRTWDTKELKQIGEYNSTTDTYSDYWGYSFRFDLPITEVPLEAGKLTFKTKISVNDSWPLPISMVVRQRLQSSSLKLVDVALGEDDRILQFGQKQGPAWKQAKLTFGATRSMKFRRTRYADGDGPANGHDASDTAEDSAVPYFRLGYDSPRLEDRFGNVVSKHRYSIAGTKAEVEFFDSECSSSSECSVSYRYHLTGVPATSNPIALKADYRIQGEQPLPIRVVIRR
jgi:hypothetical protein